MTQMRSAFCTVDSRCAMTSVVRLRGEARQRLLHQPLRFRVERARRLVEQQDRRVLEDGARERQALALAARKPQAAVADLGVVALRLRHDEVVGGGRLGRGTIAACGAPRRPSAMLARDGVVEQRHVLADDGDGAAQRGERDVADVLAVDGDAARDRRRTGAARD